MGLRNSLRKISRRDSEKTPSAMSSKYQSDYEAGPSGPAIRVEDPPPQYSATAAPAPAPGFVRSNQARPASMFSDSDPYAFLADFDTIFLIDDSGSMGSSSLSGSMRGTSWEEAATTIAGIAPICAQYDEDGIDIYFLNHKSGNKAPEGHKAAGGYYNISSAEAVQDIFSSVNPSGRTPTGRRLNTILKPYMQLVEQNRDSMDDVKPINIIIITDGAPTDDVEGPIIEAAARLDDYDAPSHQVGIQFFQVGKIKEAAAALQDLDDDLSKQYKIRDMVDTVSWAEESDRSRLNKDLVLKTVLGAVNRRYDRRPTKVN